METAKLIKELSGWTGSAALYKLSEPLDGNKFVIVSAVIAMFSGPETYIFPSNSKGKVIDWSELEGSYRGGLSHTKALRSVGYEITG